MCHAAGQSPEPRASESVPFSRLSGNVQVAGAAKVCAKGSAAENTLSINMMDAQARFCPSVITRDAAPSCPPPAQQRQRTVDERPFLSPPAASTSESLLAERDLGWIANVFSIRPMHRPASRPANKHRVAHLMSPAASSAADFYFFLFLARNYC